MFHFIVVSRLFSLKTLHQIISF